MWEALGIPVKPNRRLSSRAQWAENRIGSVISPLGKRSTRTGPAWGTRCPCRLDCTLHLLTSRGSALSPLPARPHGSSTWFPQDMEEILILPWSEAPVSLIFQNFLPQGLIPTTAHRPLNNLSRLTLRVGWWVLMLMIKSASMLKLSSKTCSMFLDLPCSPFGLVCASRLTAGVHGGDRSWQQFWLKSFASGEVGHVSWKEEPNLMQRLEVKKKPL